MSTTAASSSSFSLEYDTPPLFADFFGSIDEMQAKRTSFFGFFNWTSNLEIQLVACQFHMDGAIFSIWFLQVSEGKTEDFQYPLNK